MSIAEAYDSEMSCVASFFSRDQQARRETRFLFQTIAFQLGSAKGGHCQGIGGSNNPERQLRKLVLDPICEIVDSFSSPIVVVLDALDECEEEDAVTRIIELLVAELRNRIIPLKFFVTSRPGIYMRSMFQSPKINSNTDMFVSHEVQPYSVQHDIQDQHFDAEEDDSCSLGARQKMPFCGLPWSSVGGTSRRRGGSSSVNNR